jgi:PilZ domain
MRATRFPLHTPVRYRAVDGRWHSGMTESISKSGILLRVDAPLKPETAIEMELQLPAVGGEEPARVICSGKIVRSLASFGASDATFIAATIAHYRFDRPGHNSAAR